MRQKSFIIHNRGMNRDLSVSKAGESSAYENHNIRITSTNHDTMLSITNERGNKMVDDLTVEGELVGWNVLGNHLILFTTKEGAAKPDFIYRIDKSGDTYYARKGRNGNIGSGPLFNGNLGFSTENPIESVVYFESEDVQKIYWVDGIHVLRFMNFMADFSEVQKWQDLADAGDNTYFDSNRSVDFTLSVKIEKDNSGNTRPNGTGQYFVTYFNEHGQESGHAWVSDLVYFSPEKYGGGADSANNNKVTLTLSNLDQRFSNFRVYLLMRSSFNGTAVTYLVAEGKVSDSDVTVIDDASHLVSEDTGRLLFLGGQEVHAGTMTHKDNVLFLGDLKSIGRSDYQNIQDKINETMFEGGAYVPDTSWKSACVEFAYSDNMNLETKDIPYVRNGASYSYESQLKYTSAEILSFKGGEKYRFALVFQTPNGVKSRAFWIGDMVNPLYPKVDEDLLVIKRIVAKCTLPTAVVNAAKAAGFATVQLHIAEATYSDRSVKAQGIVNPTVFNTWERYNNRSYASASWISRPRNSKFAFKHFEPIHNATSPFGEIECNYWDSETNPKPYYYLTKETSGSKTYYRYSEDFSGADACDYCMIIYGVFCKGIVHNYDAHAIVVQATLDNQDQTVETALLSYEFKPEDLLKVMTNTVLAEATQAESGIGTHTIYGEGFTIKISMKSAQSRVGDSGKGAVWADIYDFLHLDMGISDRIIVKEPTFISWCNEAKKDKRTTHYYNEQLNSEVLPIDSVADIFNAGLPNSGADRWFTSEDMSSIDRSEYEGAQPAYHNKNLMFVDENTVTLNSPEIEYNAVSFDNVSGYKFRIVGAAKITSNISDYTADIAHGKLPGENLNKLQFSSSGSNLEGLISWPLWSEYGLDIKRTDENGNTYKAEEDPLQRTSSDYIWGGDIVKYWLHMWNRGGKVTGFTDDENSDYSTLRTKTFANLRFAYSSYFNNYKVNPVDFDIEAGALRVFNSVSSQLLGVTVGQTEKYYSGTVTESLAMPGSKKYPILYSKGSPYIGSEQITYGNYLYTDIPVQLQYASTAHAVVSLPTEIGISSGISGMRYMKQTLLPYLFDSDRTIVTPKTGVSEIGALVPWMSNEKLIPDYINPVDKSIDVASHVFTVESYSASQNMMTAEYSGQSNDVAFVEYWDKCLALLNGGTTYTRIVGAEGTHEYSYIVDCSVFTKVEDTENHTVTIRLENASVIGRAEESDTTKTLQVRNHILEESSGKYSLNTYTGYFILVGSGTYVSEAELSDSDFTQYRVNQDKLTIAGNPIKAGERYVLIGEIYYDYDADAALNPASDIRYGGIKESDVRNCRFIPAGPQYNIDDMSGDGATDIIYANQGDTYFQRWDCLKTKQYSSDCINNVIDITSVLLETHINIDGRTDNNRGTGYLASIDTSSFGSLNSAYSQTNNFQTQVVTDPDLDTDVYRSSVTWTLPKADLADVDEWTHITLSSTLTLDGDKGACNALRRLQNSIIAFQDKGIAEILFNSRTQLSTTSGVPVEIANSGKVDGKRYITNKFGCVNKWSITEGKSALYFVDNINKSFCAMSGNGIEELSKKLGFGAWFRNVNNTSSWTPKDFNNFVAFYDNLNSDVYLIKRNTDADSPCLVYNETLGLFTSFYDYSDVPMMTNIMESFVSYKNNNGDGKLWLQNRGMYCNFFGEQYDFWTTYRVTPDPYGDKIWTNFEYRADAYRILDISGDNIIDEKDLLDGGETESVAGNYQANETFDDLTVWNEYQQTMNFANSPIKKFRIWRVAIPRAIKTDSNKYGLDRIRNPWINIKFKKTYEDNSAEKQDLMQLHDITVTYFE